MNNFFEQFKNEAHKVHLTHAEKSAMKARILGMPAHPAGAPSPYFFFDFQFMQRAFVPLLAVLVVLGGGGTAYASEGALPGDPLYSIKVGVVEPLRTTLAIGAEARAEAHLALAERRLEEAEALAAQGKLTEETTAELENNFETHASAADALALEVGHTDPSGAVAIQTRARSGLSVRGAILASLGAESADEGSRSNSSALAARVIARAEGTAAASAQNSATLSLKVAAAPAPVAEDAPGEVQTMSFAAPDTLGTTISATATAATEPSVAEDARTAAARGEERPHIDERMQKRAEAALKDARKAYAEVKADLTKEMIEKVDQQFTRAEAFLNEGEYAQALALAVRLKALLEAQAKHRGDVITPLLNLRLDIGDRD